MTFLAKFRRFFTAHDVSGLAVGSSSRRRPSTASQLIERPSAVMHPLTEAAILRYQDILRNYELSVILGVKSDPGCLDLAKLDIADSVLRARGITSYISDSQLRQQAVELVRRGEAPPIPRPAIPAWLRWKVFRRDHYKCVKCGRHWGLAADHIVPYSKGGPTTEENLQTLCSTCNSKKGASL